MHVAFGKKYFTVPPDSQFAFQLLGTSLTRWSYLFRFQGCHPNAMATAWRLHLTCMQDLFLEGRILNGWSNT